MYIWYGRAGESVRHGEGGMYVTQSITSRSRGFEDSVQCEGRMHGEPDMTGPVC